MLDCAAVYTALVFATVSILVLNASTVNEDRLTLIKTAITRDIAGAVDPSHLVQPTSLNSENPDSTRTKFLANSYLYYTKELPIYVIESSLSQMEFGNHFGRIVNDLACARKARLHAIIIDTKYDILFGDESVDAGSRFVRELCGVYPHQHPVKNMKNAIRNVETYCRCTLYCWEDSRAPWVDFVLPLREIFRKGLTVGSFWSPLMSSRSSDGDVDNTVISTPATARTITTDPATLVTSVVFNTILETVPSVAIQFRCSDNFRHNMGMLPFPAMFERVDKHWDAILHGKNLSDPSSYRVHIYIMTEHPSRLYNAPLKHICPAVISTLQKELSVRYPGSLVSVQRGMMFQTWFQFLHADVVICSASTFCLWPALGNSRGVVYLPMTTLFANKTAVDFGVDNVHFVRDYELFGVDSHTMNSSYVISELSKWK